MHPLVKKLPLLLSLIGAPALHSETLLHIDAGAPLTVSTDGMFRSFETKLPARKIEATVTQVREARPVRAVLVGGLAKA